MPYNVPLEKMTLAEKLQALESLWTDISQSPQDVPSPAWHRDVLMERRRLVAERKVRFLNWDEAIAELESRTP